MAKGEATSTNTKQPTDKAAKTPKVEGEKGAPRPRKYDYGIADDNKLRVVTMEEEPKLKAKEAEAYAAIKKGPKVSTFLENHERALIRRLGRKKLIEVVGVDGTIYPREYVAPEPKPKAEKAEKAGKAAA